MGTQAESATSLRRLRSRASTRITEVLLGSSGRVAAIGLVTACATLAFTIWFRISLEHQSQVRAPAARASLQMRSAVNRSLAALRGWVAYGEPDAMAERALVWEERLAPGIIELRRLAEESGGTKLLEQVGALQLDLRELERIQWLIEDVARRPGNEPARVEYERRLEPLRHSLLLALRDVVEMVGARESDPARVRLLVDLARFRAAFTESDLALGQLLARASAAREHEVSRLLETARGLAGRITEDAPAAVDGDALELIRFTLREFRAYRLQVPEVVAVRLSPRWNVAQRLFSEDALPLVARVKALTADLASEQARSSAEAAARLTRASYGVIALSLLMGLLSAGSLFVSLRLRREMKNVVDRARRLGQYVIDARLGRGGMGEVFLAHHAMLRRPTAIKLLRADSAEDVGAQTRFRHEVQLTCQLTHPNTIEIFDYGRTPEGVFYYAMEYVDGFTLQSLVDRTGPVAPARVVHILLQCCGSLGEAHERGLLHRDVKPRNIMLTERGAVSDSVKMLDFGLVRDLGQGLTEPDRLAGTPMYIAPEAILSPDTVTAQADLYALGAVGYFLLTGTAVFSSGPMLEVFERHLTEEPDLPSERLGRDLPRDLETVILAALSKDPADRPASAVELAEMLRACELGAWSQAEAKLWWEEFGESVKAEVSQGDEERSSILASGIEITIGASDRR